MCRRLYSQRMGTVEPVFGNIRHNKRLNRFTLRGKAKVNGQWHLYCLVHNIEIQPTPYEPPMEPLHTGQSHESEMDTNEKWVNGQLG